MADNAEIRRRGLFTPEKFRRAIECLGELLDATKIERAQRAPGMPQAYQEVPDNPIRLAAAKLLIELETGKAPQTLELTAPGAGGLLPTSNDAVAILAANPKLTQRILGDYFDAMKKAQKAGVLEVYDANPGQPPESQSGGPQSKPAQSYQKPTK